MRYSIHFTPPAHDPLVLAAGQWLGRNAFSGEATEPPSIRGLDLPDIAFHTALPRRTGFQAMLKAPFRPAAGVTEQRLLRHLMRFAGNQTPFALQRLEVARLGNFFGLAPISPCAAMQFLAACVVQEFDSFRAPPTETELERSDPGDLSAAQLANLYRWGYPYVMEEFRFHMPLTGPLSPADIPRLEPPLRTYFNPLLEREIDVANLALFIEEEAGAPLMVHSLHPLGRVGVRKTA